MRTSACLMSCEPATRSRPSSTSTAIGRWGDLGHEERFQGEVPGELLVEAALGVPTLNEAVGEGQPGSGLARVVVSLQQERCALAQVEAGHDVRVGVVVDDLVVLIGPHHPEEVAVALGVGADATCPVAGGLDDEVPTRAVEEGGVARPGRVTGRGPGHVGDDVLLMGPGADRDHLAVPPFTWRGVTSLPSPADSHGKRAPARPSDFAAARAAGRRRMRYSSIARAASGRIAASAGSTKTSASQKTWPE